MHKYRHESLLALFALVVIGPVLYYHIPPYYFTPDILYVKAKLLAVMRGDIFSDPVTGFPTFHPPFYHMFLAVLRFLGLSAEYLPLIVSIANVGATLVFVYLLTKRLFDKTTALFTALLLPFINQFLGPSYLFLATAFYFSVPIYLAGLWVYVKEEKNSLSYVVTGLLWGIAFIISPVYFFPIGLIFLFELFWNKNPKNLALIVIPFLITLIPFHIQMYQVYSLGMAGTSAFAIWRGVPDGEWIIGFFRYFLSPSDGNPDRLLIIPAMLLFGFGILGVIKSKGRYSLIIAMAAAYILTAYHFNYFQYGPRILFFLSILLSGFAVNFIIHQWRKKRIGHIILTCLTIATTGFYLSYTTSLLAEHAGLYHEFNNIGQGLRDNLDKHITPGSFILASEQSYRNFIMPYFPVKSLVAYKTGKYFQVNSRLSDEMQNDYNLLTRIGSPEKVDFVCKKYRMNVSVIGGKDKNLPGFEYIISKWKLVYRDQYYAIYVKP
ncbi:MAG: glycosyltransferase family 39 protein [candidate division Zixibacteria bacterium]|nr:glycosyltransferase family 39 protein [candidate division Zixibacteria bacterium]